MSQPYREILERIRIDFPQPVSDRVHDSYFVHTLMRALDRVDDLKSERPILGSREPVDFASATAARLPEGRTPLEDVTRSLVDRFRGLSLWGHPLQQQNVVPPATIASLVGTLLAALYSPNLVEESTSHRVALAELEVVAMAAALVGYDPEVAAGFFTFGGTGTTLFGVKLGIEKAQPGAMRHGVRDDLVVLASDTAHYCRYNVAGWLGIGEESVLAVPSDARNAIDLDALRGCAEEAIRGGRKIAAFIATLGTTDAFGLDDLAGIVKLRDELVARFALPYRPHVHADAVIGWAWSVFDGYDFVANPLGFRPRTVRALAGVLQRVRALALADSIGFDFHKTGFVPYVSSLLLARDRADLELVRREASRMPYLFHHGAYHPGTYTLETSRAGTGILAALANLELLGREGLRVILGHVVEMTQLLREHLEGHAATTVLNRDNFGTVTLFRVYPDGVDTFSVKERELADPAYRDELLRHNEYNRRIYRHVYEEAMAGRGALLSLTECYRRTAYGEPIVALKSFILSPFADEENVASVLRKVLEARERIDGGA